MAHDPEPEPEKQAEGEDEGRGRLPTLAVDLPRFGGSSAILMIERIQALDLLWDGAENAVNR